MGAAKVSEPEEERRVLAITDLRLGQCGSCFGMRLKLRRPACHLFLSLWKFAGDFSGTLHAVEGYCLVTCCDCA